MHSQTKRLLNLAELLRQSLLSLSTLFHKPKVILLVKLKFTLRIYPQLINPLVAAIFDSAQLAIYSHYTEKREQ